MRLPGALPLGARAVSDRGSATLIRSRTPAPSSAPPMSRRTCRSRCARRHLAHLMTPSQRHWRAGAARRSPGAGRTYDGGTLIPIRAHFGVLALDDRTLVMCYYDAEPYEPGVPKRSDIKLATVSVG